MAGLNFQQLQVAAGDNPVFSDCNNTTNFHSGLGSTMLKDTLEPLLPVQGELDWGHICEFEVDGYHRLASPLSSSVISMVSPVSFKDHRF